MKLMDAFVYFAEKLCFPEHLHNFIYFYGGIKPTSPSANILKSKSNQLDLLPCASADLYYLHS